MFKVFSTKRVHGEVNESGSWSAGLKALGSQRETYVISIRSGLLQYGQVIMQKSYLLQKECPKYIIDLLGVPIAIESIMSSSQKDYNFMYVL